MKKKVLNIMIRGKHYTINEDGHINGSSDWIFLGGSTHHWHNRITIPFEKSMENYRDFVGCLMWDKDHGTTRQWGGSYNGKLPRITDAWITYE